MQPKLCNLGYALQAKQSRLCCEASQMTSDLTCKVGTPFKQAIKQREEIFFPISSCFVRTPSGRSCIPCTGNARRETKPQSGPTQGGTGSHQSPDDKLPRRVVYCRQDPFPPSPGGRKNKHLSRMATPVLQYAYIRVRMP